MTRETAEASQPQTVDQKDIATSYLYSKLKRSMDLFFSAVGLIFAATIYLPVAFLIKIDSHGPVLYRQRRLGVDGQTFFLIKFRTMADGAETPGGPVFTAATDRRVTMIGRFLRRTYLDEFPQCWNVLKGEMSMVGPRPERPEMADQIIARYPGFRSRTIAKPGITGLAQIEYGYVNTMLGSKHKLSYDQLYIERASAKVDLWIIIRTLISVIRRRGS